MLELSSAQCRELRAQAHHLHPVVSIAGKGLTDAVLKEIDAALKVHELIKVRVYGDDREVRAAYLNQICEQLECAPVQNIGKLLIVFRPNPELHASPATPSSKTPSRRKSASREASFNKRPGRPTTANAPRKTLAGAPETRYRKPSAGSSRSRKSAR
jgi:RNA-binding protein